MKRTESYNLFNNIFYALVFLGFFFPTNNSYYLPIGGALIKFNELALLLLPFINELCRSSFSFKLRDNQLRMRVIVLVFIIVVSDVILKYFVYRQSVGDGIKSLRLALPMLVGLFLLFRGIRVNVKTLYNVFIYSLLVSFILSLVAFFYPHPVFYYGIDSAEMGDIQKARLSNSNFGFGLIGAYLLFRDRGKWYNNRKVYTITYALSVLILVMSFNRTYLALLMLEFFLLNIKNISLSRIIKVTFIGSLVFLAIFSLYSTNALVKRQIDVRILDIIFEDKSLQENVIENNRDAIYDGIKKRLNESYWIIGLDYRTEIFNHTRHGTIMGASKTDISFVNILLRYGVIPLIMYLLILRKIMVKRYFPKLVLGLLIVSSLNIDSLMNHNIVFFLFLLIPVFNLETYRNIYYPMPK